MYFICPRTNSKSFWNKFDKCESCGSIRPNLFIRLIETETITLWNKESCFIMGHKFAYKHLSKTQTVTFLLMWKDKELYLCENFKCVPCCIKEEDAKKT